MYTTILGYNLEKDMSRPCFHSFKFEMLEGKIYGVAVFTCFLKLRLLKLKKGNLLDIYVYLKWSWNSNYFYLAICEQTELAYVCNIFQKKFPLALCIRLSFRRLHMEIQLQNLRKYVYFYCEDSTLIYNCLFPKPMFSQQSGITPAWIGIG